MSWLTVPDVSDPPVPDSSALPAAVPILPGEAEAQRHLSASVEGEDLPIFRHAQARDRLDWDDTSHLSPYLRFGILSSGRAVFGGMSAIDATPSRRARQGGETWLNELIWRKSFVHILYYFP